MGVFCSLRTASAASANPLSKVVPLASFYLPRHVFAGQPYQSLRAIVPMVICFVVLTAIVEGYVHVSYFLASKASNRIDSFTSRMKLNISLIFGFVYMTTTEREVQGDR